ncbi:MAG: hypothetical protein HY897_12295 [Deltaproteobacteria bacterium]|nr:hypothetical protein [Deltaproteobacteria bacterium]
MKGTRSRLLSGAAVVFFLAFPAGVSAQGQCLPDPGAGKVYICDPLIGSSSEGDVHGGTFEADGGWSARTRSDGIHYVLGDGVVEGRLSFYVRRFGDQSLPNNDHIIVVADNFPWKAGDPDCRWIEIKIWGVADTGEGSIFSARGNNCGQTKIVRDHDHAFYDPAAWYHFEIAFDDKEATWSLDGKVLATSTYDCPMSFNNLYIPKALTNKAEDPPIGAVYEYVSFAGTPGDPCGGTAHCSNGQKDCGETGVDCGGGCDPCAEPDAGVPDAGIDAGGQDAGAPDAGQPGDTGTPDDTGVANDAGDLGDAGALADAGAHTDSQVAADSGGNADLPDGASPKTDAAGADTGGAGAPGKESAGCGCSMLGI